MVILQLVGWFLISCVLVSFIEHQVHARLMHRRSTLRFEKTFIAHAITHHRDHYGEVFSDEPVAPGEDTEIRMNVHRAPIKVFPIAVVIALIYWPGAIIFTLTAMLHHWIWNKIHLEMHKPEQRSFSQWPAYKFLTRYHYLHHRYPNKNFNVVFPFADYVLGTHARGTAADHQKMVELGFYGQPPAAVISESSKESLEREPVSTR